MATGMTQENNLEKQMGCMAGFLQLFDRHQILSGKKFPTTKRLTPPTASDASGSEKSSAASPDVSRELSKPKRPATTPSPERPKPTSPAVELKSPTPPSLKSTPPKTLPIFNVKEGTKSSWKFKETPRLSLDSRASYDATGSLHRKEIRADRVILPSNPSEDAEEESGGDIDDKQRARSSTSVIARLMGLEPISQADPEPVKPAELRRSASESRVTRDLFQHRFIDGSNTNNSHLKQPNQSHCNSYSSNAVRYNGANSASRQRGVDPMERVLRNGKSEVMGQQSKGLNKGLMTSSAWKLPQHPRSFFEAAEVFPEQGQKQPVMSVYGEIEKRLRIRGIDEASKDLETLKHILEAWQLKGLLRSSRHLSEQVNNRNIVYDRSFPNEDSPIAVMRPSRLSPVNRRMDSRNVSNSREVTPSVSPRRERNVRSPSRSSSDRSDGTLRRSNSIVKPMAMSVETQRRVNESTENRRSVPNSPSPRISPRRTGSDQTVRHRSPRTGKKPTADIYQKEKITTIVFPEDESSSISESTVSTSSQTDTERSKIEEHKEGSSSLLERCDKLLSSIAEMSGTEQQSSPISVLDSSFYESASPSPIMKRSIDFKDNYGEALEEETWSHLIFSNQSKLDDAPQDCELVYISEILRAAHYLPEDSDIFSLLEKQQRIKGKDTSKVSRIQRKLIFDTIQEIIERNKQLPPWKDCISRKPSLVKIWSEFQKIRERNGADDLVEVIWGVLKKDLAGDAISGWGGCPVELSEVVLDIERMIFRDLVGETIRDLAVFACQSTVLLAPRRKLVF